MLVLASQLANNRQTKTLGKQQQKTNAVKHQKNKRKQIYKQKKGVGGGNRLEV